MSIFSKISVLKSLRWKSVVVSSIICLGVCILLTWVHNKFTLDEISTLSVKQYNDLVDSYTKELEQGLNQTMKGLESSSQAIGMISERNSLDGKPFANKLLAKMFESHKTIKSVWIISEPYMLENSDSLLINTNPGFPIGWYQKLSVRESQSEPEISSDLQTTSSDIYELYREMKTDKKPKIVSSRDEDETSSKVNCMMPILVGQKFAGMIGAEIDMKYYRGQIDALIPTDFLINICDNAGKIFYSRKKNLQGKNIKEVFRFTDEKYHVLSKTSENISIDEHIVAVELDNQEVYIHNKKISLQGFNESFALIAMIPSTRVLEKTKAISTKNYLMTIIAYFIFISLLALVSGYLSRPMEIVKNLLHKLVKGDFNLDKDREMAEKLDTEYTNMIDSIFSLSYSLRQTARFANQIRDGKLDSKLSIKASSNQITKALDDMRNTLVKNQKEQQARLEEEKRSQWATGGHSLFSDILRNNISDLKKLCVELINNLVPFIEVSQGGIFIRTTLEDQKFDEEIFEQASYNEDDTQVLDHTQNSKELVKNAQSAIKEEYLELYGVFAYGHERFHKKIVGMDEGLIGACAMEKHYILLNNVPDDYMDISSGLGSTKPSAVLFVPLVFNDYLYGVMEFASINKFEDYKIEFANRIAESAASTIANAKINQQTSILLSQTRERSKVMIKRERVLKDQVSELTDQLNQLKDSQKGDERFRQALNRTMLCAKFSLKGEIIEANRKFTLRYLLDVNDIKRKNIYDVLQLTLGHYDNFKKVWDTIVQGASESYIAEIKVNNTIRKIKNNFVPIYGKDNRPESVFCMSFDVTNEQIREEELEKLRSSQQENDQVLAVAKEKLRLALDDVEELTKDITNVKKQNADIRQRYEKADTSAQFFKKELEKRINKFHKIETTLKEKLKNLENQVKELQQKNDQEGSNTENQ